MARRHAGTGGRTPGADAPADTAGPEPALGRALHANALDSAAEQQAMAAFRAARVADTHEQAQTRNQDDWRPRRTAARRSVRTAIAVFVGGLTLGGVAIAAIGSPASSGSTRGDALGRRHPSSTAPEIPAAAPGDTAPSQPAGFVSRSRPPTARDIQAHCRAYPSVKGRGNALNSTAWQRFLTAAGREDNVAANCADRLSRTGTGNASKAIGKPSTGPAAEKRPADRNRHEPGTAPGPLR
ncbi:hypothetical protein [Streptomyces sp. NPDC093261]|uniref:hypothetical protein n=1 Tax=Streptomyces sp. NPDC093261 TaxID=3366037 RepID=UPI0038234015